MTDKSDVSNITTLMGNALAQFSKLFQNEIDLAKAEFGEKARHVSVGVGFLAGAAILVIPPLIMTLFALSAALVNAGWSEPAAHLFSALAAGVVGGILAIGGMRKLKAEKLKPEETIRQLERDKETMKGFVR